MSLRKKFADAAVAYALSLDTCSEEMQERLTFFGPLPAHVSSALADRRAYHAEYSNLGEALLKTYQEQPVGEEPDDMPPALYVVWHALSGDDNLAYLAITSLDEKTADAALYAILEAFEERQLTGTPSAEVRHDMQRLIVGLASERSSSAMRLRIAREVLVYGAGEDGGTARERVRDLLGRETPDTEWNDALAEASTDGHFVCYEDWQEGLAFVKAVLEFGADDVFIRLVVRQLLHWNDDAPRESFVSLVNLIPK